MANDLRVPFPDGTWMKDAAHHEIAIGNFAGRREGTGSYNVFLGDCAGNEHANVSHRFVLKTGAGTIESEITTEEYEMLEAIIRRGQMHFVDITRDMKIG